MAGETIITIVGNLTRDPELRTVGSGSTVVNFTIASSSRQFNRNTNQWEDGDTLFLNCSAWDSARNSLASNIANSLSKGMTVIAQGRLTQRSYQAQDGSQRRRGAAGGRHRPIAAPRHGAGESAVVELRFRGQPAAGRVQRWLPGRSRLCRRCQRLRCTGAPQQQAQAPVSDPWNSAEPSGSSFGSFGTSEFGGGSDEPEF